MYFQEPLLQNSYLSTIHNRNKYLKTPFTIRNPHSYKRDYQKLSSRSANKTIEKSRYHSPQRYHDFSNSKYIRRAYSCARHRPIQKQYSISHFQGFQRKDRRLVQKQKQQFPKTMFNSFSKDRKNCNKRMISRTQYKQEFNDYFDLKPNGIRSNSRQKFYYNRNDSPIRGPIIKHRYQKINNESTIDIKNTNKTINTYKQFVQKNRNVSTSYTDNQNKIQNYYMQNLSNSLKKPYSTDYFQILFRDHFIQNYQSVKRIRQLREIGQPLKLNLGKRDPNKSKTLIFDLDQTLVHCCDPHQPCDAILKLQMPSGQIIESRLNVRPFAKQILQKLEQNFQIFVFTASHSIYANKVIDKLLDPEGKNISHRLCRENCSQTQQGYFIKDICKKTLRFNNS